MVVDKYSLICVFEVPLKESGGDYDYDFKDIKYSADYQWTDDDKSKIKRVIDEFCNSYDKTGEKKVLTTVGEVIIKHEQHPKAKRLRLIQGFIQQRIPSSVSPYSNQSFSLLSILKEVTPESLVNNQEARKNLEILAMLIKPSENNSIASKFRVFDSILQIILDNNDEYTDDDKAAARLSNIVDNLRKLYPSPSEHHQ